MKPGIVPLRPLSVGEILDGAITAVRRSPSLILASGIVSVFTVLTNFVIQLLLQRSSNDTSGADVFRGLVVSVIGLVLSAVGSLIVAALAAVVVREGVLGRSVPLATAWREVRPRVGVVVGAALLSTLAWGGLTITVIGIPFAIFLYVAWRFGTVVAIVEGGSATGVLKRSRLITKNRWWRTCGVLLLVALVGGIVSEIITLPFLFAGGTSALLSGDGSLSTTELALTSVGSLIAATLVTPFTVCATALLYVDLRMRGEGLDVALRQAATTTP